MPGGNKNINGNDGKRFSSTYQPKNAGRKPSIRNQLKAVLEADGQLTIPAGDVVEVNEDGSVTIKVPTEMQLAVKLSTIASSSKANEALKAIQMIMEQIDGKPKQETETTIKGESSETWLTAFKKAN